MSDKVMHFAEIIEELEKAYKSLQKKGYYKWKKPLLTNTQMLCTGDNINNYLSKENVSFLRKERKLDDLHIILTVAVRLGIQQGIYLVDDNPFSYLETDDIDEFINKIKHIKKHKKKMLNDIRKHFNK